MSELPGAADLAIYQGDTYTVQFLWEVDAVPVDLTDYTGRMVVAKAPGSTTTFLDVVDWDTTPTGDQIVAMTLGGVAGTVTVELTAAQTAALDFRHAVYDVELTSSGGEVRTLVAGEMGLVREVTP